MPRFSAPVVGEPLEHDADDGATKGSFAADLDADGYPELITFHFNYWQGDVAAPVDIFAGTPSTHLFRPRTSRFISGTLPRLVHPSSFLTADLNDDGITDLFLGGSGFDQPPFAGERDWLLLSRPEQKHVGKVAPARDATFTHTSAVGDIDRDGVLDIYVGSICCTHCCAQGAYFLMGRRGLPPVGSYQRLHATVADRLGNFFTAAALVDIDDEKGVDLVLASGGYDDTGSVVYLNDGTGHFLSSTPDLVLPVGLFGPQTITVEVVAADVNSDGRPDLILSQTDNDPFYTGYGLQIFVGGKNGFVDRTDALLPRRAAYQESGMAFRGAIYLADFYGDGIVDFVASGFYSNDVAAPLIWINDGSGKFRAYPRQFFDKEVTYPDSVNIIPLDLNHDRRSDVAWLTPRLTPRGLTETVVRTYINEGAAAGTVAPQVVKQSADVAVAEGQPLVLSATVRGSRPLRFQWYKDGTAMRGAIHPVFRVRRSGQSNAGRYELRIRNAAGQVWIAPIDIRVSASG